MHKFLLEISLHQNVHVLFVNGHVEVLGHSRPRYLLGYHCVPARSPAQILENRHHHLIKHPPEELLEQTEYERKECFYRSPNYQVQES